MKRTLSLIIVLAMAFSLMLGVIPSAEEAAGELDISEARVEFGDVVYLLIGVDYTAADAEGITLQITNNKTGAQTILEPDASIEVREGRVAFKYTDLGAKNIGDELTLQALKNGVASGDSVKYSVLEYAIKAQSLGDANLTNLVNAMVAYGAAAQKAYEHEGSYDLAKNYGLVVVSGSAQGKAIAEVGSTAAFTPNVEGATLYDMSLNAVNAVTVPAGFSRFFYISAAQTTFVNFDATSAKAGFEAEDVVITANTYKLYYSTSPTDRKGEINGVGNTVEAKPESANVGNIQFYKMPAGVNFKAVTGSEGYWGASSTSKLNIDIREFYGQNAVREMEDGVFTLAMTVGFEGTNIFTGKFKFGSNTEGVFRMFANGENSEQVDVKPLLGEDPVNGGDTVICSVNKEEGKNTFFTLYIVVDINTGTYTFYNDQNGTVIVSQEDSRIANLKTVFAEDGTVNTFFRWYANAANQSILVKKIKLFEGNIFE